MEEKPNIILFITHDQGQFLGCYNSSLMPNSLSTPNINRLAKSGVRFNNYFCTAPQCSPSRGSLMTGLYPHQNGLLGLVNLGWTLPENHKTLPMYLSENGYSTHLLGLQHESIDVSSLGYDKVSERIKSYKYTTKKMENKYIEFFEERAVDDKIFFVNIGTIEMHRPFVLWSDPVDSKYVKVPPFLPDNEMIREDLGLFYGSIENVDLAIGKILQSLEKLGLRKNTLFIYTTDHGSPFPRAKCTLYDPGIKIALVLNHPESEVFNRGKVINGMISNVDLLPTILDLIGTKRPKMIEGKSFLPLLQNLYGTFRNEIYTEKTYHEIYDPMRSVRTENYKYIRNFESLDTLYQLPLDIKKGLSGKFIEETIKIPREEEELYNLENDPNEKTNLIDDSTHIKILTNLRQKLMDWMIKTQDPLLQGRIKNERKKISKIY
ncbi:MAG: sulfatase [Candidatus Thorarchaeota archaeon]